MEILVGSVTWADLLQLRSLTIMVQEKKMCDRCILGRLIATAEDPLCELQASKAGLQSYQGAAGWTHAISNPGHPRETDVGVPQSIWQINSAEWRGPSNPVQMAGGTVGGESAGLGKRT